MATTGKTVTNEKRKKLVAKYAALREQLKTTLSSESASPAEKDKARKKMASLPRNSAAIRVRNRCEQTGRPRGYLRKFKMSRIALRRFGLRGDIPGLIKSSW